MYWLLYLIYYFCCSRYINIKCNEYYNNISSIIKTEINLDNLLYNIIQLHELAGLNKKYLEHLIEQIINENVSIINFENMNNHKIIDLINIIQEYNIDNLISFLQFLIINLIEYQNNENLNITKYYLYCKNDEKYISSYLKNKLIDSKNRIDINQTFYWIINQNDIYDYNNDLLLDYKYLYILKKCC